jgi:hypothetical protein
VRSLIQVRIKQTFSNGSMSSRATSIFKDPKKDRQYNDQKEKDKRTNNDPQNITHTTKDRATRTTLKPWAISGTPEGKQFLIHMLKPLCRTG